MQDFYPTITNPLIYTLPFFAVLIGIEISLSLKHDKQLYYWNDFFASLGTGVGASILAIFTKLAALATFFFVFELFRPVRLMMGYDFLGWAWYTWIICQFCDDFCYYWYHRLSHTVRILWAAHLVHHSSEHFNLGSGIRNGWFTLFYKPIFWLWMAAIGFHPIMMATCLGIQAIYQFHLHTKSISKLGWIEKFINTPTQHQVHHSRNYYYLDKNHGGFLNIFDRLFGTYLPLDEEKIETKYGVLHPPHSYNPLVIVTYEYQRIWEDVKKSPKLKDKLMYIFGPPGWSHDGSSKTTKQIQREMLAQEKAEQEAKARQQAEAEVAA